MARDIGRFGVSPRLAVMLGESYRTAEQALKELVDNAWDADSPSVDISLPSVVGKESKVVIADAGEGMSPTQVRSEYLRIARDRRKDRGARTAKLKRQVKGRKGVGKFAGIIIAEVMEVETRQAGKLSKFTIDRKRLEDSPGDIVEINVPIEELTCQPGEVGTTITLSFLAQSINFPTAESLRHALAPDYGREEMFEIRINGTRLDHLQMSGHKAVEMLAVPGSKPVAAEFIISDRKLPKAVQGIVVKVMGKIVGPARFFGLDQDETVPPRLLQQVSGVLNADDLEDEAARTGWTDLNESEKKVQAVFAAAGAYLKEQLRFAYQAQMSAAHARFMKKYKARLGELPEHKREYAKQQILQIVTRFLGRDDRAIEVIELMLRGLEQDDYWTVLKALIDAKSGDIATIAEALASFGIVDLALVARTASARLASLDAMRKLINDETLEATMHAAVEQNLWIFGSEFMLLSSNEQLQSIIPKALSARLKARGDDKKRPDLLLLNRFKGRHLLIEFKRPSDTVNWQDKAQAEDYRGLLLSHVSPIDIIVIGGKRIKEMQQVPEGGSIYMLTYTELVAHADAELRWLIDELKR